MSSVADAEAGASVISTSIVPVSLLKLVGVSVDATCRSGVALAAGAAAASDFLFVPFLCVDFAFVAGRDAGEARDNGVAGVPTAAVAAADWG